MTATSGFWRSEMARVVGIGNPLWDVFAPATANPDAAAGFGAGSSSHVNGERMSRLLSDLREPVWVPGGGARTALGVLAALGADTYLVGAVGDDARGDAYRQTLTEDGIADCLGRGAAPTGVCLTLTGGGVDRGRARRAPSETGAERSTSRRGGTGAAAETRRVIVASGAAAELTSMAGLAPGGPDVVFVEGFIAPREGLAAEVAAYACEAGARLAVDLGHPSVAAQAAALVEVVTAESERTAPGPGVRELAVFGAEAEVSAAGGPERLLDIGTVGGRGTAGEPGGGPAGRSRSGGRGKSGPPPTSGRHPRPGTPVTLCVKRGPSGVSVLTADGTINCSASNPVQGVLDTTGAGDVFAGAFLAAWTEGLSAETSCRFGSQVAALSLGHYGARLGAADLRRLTELFPRAQQ
jgi:sugar/nucleoside kinase (ribokinase family)